MAEELDRDPAIKALRRFPGGRDRALQVEMKCQRGDTS